jgi:uncharacterized membrane protein
VEILTIGLILACAALWRDVAGVRARLKLLEDSVLPPMPGEQTHQHELRSEPKTERAPATIVSSQVVVEETIAIEEVPTQPPPDETLPETEEPERPSLNFEELFGRRLPIWAGGVTLAVAGFLIVKYSIDAGLLSPIVRVILGLLFGTGLIIAAEAALRGDLIVRDARVRQSLAGAGIATLYATILVAANVYHLIGPLTAFGGMALVTLLAGGLSLRFGAPSAVLGLVGGLAAPALVGSGPPDVPLLASYLALTVGGLCALSRDQRWLWLGASALIGGFGWGLALLAGGALDASESISLGLFIILLGVAFPLLLLAESGTLIRLAAGLVGCAQMAALVAVGGFAPLHWALFGLISIAMIWLSRREPGLQHLPSAGLAIALFLAGAWTSPTEGMLAIVLAGILIIYGSPALLRLWSENGGIAEAAHVAAIAAVILLLPMLHFYLSSDIDDYVFALLALLGTAISAGAAALGWRSPARKDDARFPLLVATACALLIAAGALALPHWAIAPWSALVAGGLLLFARVAGDPRLEPCAWGFAAVTGFLLLSGLKQEEFNRAVGTAALPDVASAVRWIVPAAIALLFAQRAQSAHSRAIGQPFAVLLFYAAAAQLIPPSILPLVPALLLALLGSLVRPAPIPALIASFALVLLWAVIPLTEWLYPAMASLYGEPFLSGSLPSLIDTVSRLLIPAIAIAAAVRRAELSLLARVFAITSGAILGIVAAHILFKHLLVIDSLPRFIALGMPERTLWEFALAAAAVVAWRLGSRWAALVLAAASLAHFAGYTLLLHNPLWSAQSVGIWLIPAYGIAFAILHFAGRAELPPALDRARDWGKILLIPLLAISLLRQMFAGSLLTASPVGSVEDIFRSVLGALIAIGYLQWGIRVNKRDWRIASLILMLGTVAKVFLFDARGLDGLARVASFAALGFSLIGLGWLYSRYLPDSAADDARRSPATI